MPIAPDTFASLAGDNAKGMTSIRQASVVKWLRGAARGLDTRFDLLKDSALHALAGACGD